MNKLFICYSANLMKYLNKKGITYDVTGLHPESKNLFWAYIRTTEFNNTLTEWDLFKKSN